jgi:hypothetical protein
MSAVPLETYSHSGKFNPLGLILPLVAAMLVGFPLGFAYAYLIRWIPFIYVNALITAGYGLAFGWTTSRILKLGRVRNPALAALCGLSVGLIALFAQWNGHVHAMFDGAPWLIPPAGILHGMDRIYAEGSWSLFGHEVNGAALGAVWLIEAGIIVGLATLMPLFFVRDTPYCEETGCWLDEERQLNNLEPLTDDAQIEALRAGDLLPLTVIRPKAEGAAVYTRLVVKSAPNRTRLCTLRVQNVEVSIEKDGKVKETTENFTGDLILPTSMLELVARCEGFTPRPAR